MRRHGVRRRLFGFVWSPLFGIQWLWFVCRVVDRVCDRFPGLYRSGYFRHVLALFVGFLERSDDPSAYLLGLPFHIELLVLRSMMLFGCHRGFVRWLGDYLPFVPVNLAGFAPTPADFLGVDRSDSPFMEQEMWNFGEGGLVAENNVDNRGVSVPMRAEFGGDCVPQASRLVYDDVLADETVVLHSFLNGGLVVLGHAPGYGSCLC